MTIASERLTPLIFPSPQLAAVEVAREIAQLIRERAVQNRRVVLGLATGSTPIPVYRELARLHREEGLSFRNVVTFNLDEYYPMPPNNAQSYHHFMREQLFDRIDLPAEQIHIPDGTVPRDDIDAYAARYEKEIAAAGGIDLILLGIGRTGHIAFNEPGSPRHSRTRLVTLNEVTRRDASRNFSSEDEVPRLGLTMGIETILRSRRIILMAFGESKAGIIARTLEGERCEEVPATALQEHGNCLFVLDEGAAGKLSR